MRSIAIRETARFENVGQQAGVEMGRWSWSSDFLDFDHDGLSDLYVANGYISGPERNDLASFFWRQVVAKSSEDATASLAYERGWNAINELVRSDNTWHGYARNVCLLNNGDGTFTEASGPAGLDFIEDSRTFALADIDHDGRLEVILKNRNAPQIRILHNAMKEIGDSICFPPARAQKAIATPSAQRSRWKRTAMRQTKYLQAGSGFLAQHSKELFFGLGSAGGENSRHDSLAQRTGAVFRSSSGGSSHRIGRGKGNGGCNAICRDARRAPTRVDRPRTRSRCPHKWRRG